MLAVVRARVAPYVADALARDAQHVVDEVDRAGHLGAERRARRGCRSSSGRRRRLDPGERARVLAQVVELAFDALLQLGQLGEGLRGRAGAQQAPRALEAQVDAGQRLRVAVVQLAGDAMALLGHLELPHLLLKLEALLPEIADARSR